MKMARTLAALAALALEAQAQAADDIRFVACPVYRDTDAGKKSGCWLGDDPASGTRYDVTASPTKPDWNLAMLVEGKASAKPDDPCGGKILDPVRVSVLQEPCTRFLLEAEGFPGRRFDLPRRNVRPLYETRAAVAKPFAVRTFVIPFDFDSAFVTYQLTDFYLDAALNYALDVAPARVTLTGFAATAPSPVSGRTVAEPTALAEKRAELVERALVMRGFPTDHIRIRATTDAGTSDHEAFDGLTEPSRRRVQMTVEPIATP